MEQGIRYDKTFIHIEEAPAGLLAASKCRAKSAPPMFGREKDPEVKLGFSSAKWVLSYDA